MKTENQCTMKLMPINSNLSKICKLDTYEFNGMTLVNGIFQHGLYLIGGLNGTYGRYLQNTNRPCGF